MFNVDISRSEYSDYLSAYIMRKITASVRHKVKEEVSRIINEELETFVTKITLDIMKDNYGMDTKVYLKLDIEDKRS